MRNPSINVSGVLKSKSEPVEIHFTIFLFVMEKTLTILWSDCTNLFVKQSRKLAPTFSRKTAKKSAENTQITFPGIFKFAADKFGNFHFFSI